ncbi:16779_t:CDS:2, partial [Racocetra persica]
DEDLEGYRCKFNCIDKTIKSEVMNMKFDELNQKNEYCNISDDEKRAIVGIDNHWWNESEIEIDQMLLTLRNDINGRS